MRRYLIVLIVLFLLMGCTNNPDAIRILQENGYKEIQMTGYNFFSCSKDDFYHSGFMAKSPNGNSIKGTVCSGILFKNSTIRFE
jgi:hypothetical protein